MVAREWAEAEYSRIYWTVVDDEKFADVFDDDRRWSAYTRLLMTAEQAYPSAAALPRWLADDVLEHLVEVRIIELVRGSMYRVVGLRTEREGRLSGNAIGGKRRAEQAERDGLGRFVPAPAAGASDDPADAPASPANASDTASVQPGPSSSRTPGLQLRRDEDEDETSRDERISLDVRPRATMERPDVQALRDRGWKRVSPKQRAILDELLERHDVTGPTFAAEVIRATPPDKDPLEAVMHADKLWQASRRRQAEADEADAQQAKAEPSPAWLADMASAKAMP